MLVRETAGLARSRGIPLSTGLKTPLGRFVAAYTLAFAESVLTDAARMWEHAAPDHKLRLQRVFFPHGLTWDPAGKIQTPVTATAFTQLHALAQPQDRVASPTGFESRESANSVDECGPDDTECTE
jgi:hypothetical protein